MATLYEPDDKLSADRVVIFARKIQQPWRSSEKRSGRHQRMQTVATDTVECIIERKAHWIPENK
jgi:hypothetical protein